ncbi:P-loop containing nucleoside triphosphate hydrolase protein [Mycena sp. CBHHK59/15]|nr:P-loop containing nucleoside triphosphate hydrolase protein [Mycena sp. CBHHK59/15]
MSLSDETIAFLRTEGICQKKGRAPKPHTAPNPHKPVTKEELHGLEDKIKVKFEWVHEPRAHQMLGIVAQLQMRDVLVHAGTGSRKTMIAAGPHTHPSSEGKVTLMISPLIALHDEQAIVVNSSNGGCKREVLQAIQHPLNSYADLDFVVAGITNPLQIKNTFIYADNIATGVEIIDHLMELLPSECQKLGVIRPYNAALSKEYRREAMRQFKNGDIRVLVCTNTAGMGCNIPGIDLVVQWKLPGSVSIFVQRTGRAARREGREPENVQIALNKWHQHIHNTIVEESAPTHRRVDVVLVQQLPITAQTSQASGSSSGRGNPASTPSARGRGRGRGRGRQQTREEMNTEFAQADAAAAAQLAALFTCQSN